MSISVMEFQLLNQFASLSLFGIIRILSFHSDTPEFVECQAKALRKFMTESYEYIVFNDAPTEEESRKIEAVCNRHHIFNIRYPQEWHTSHPLSMEINSRFQDPSLNVKLQHVIQFALENYGYIHDDGVILLGGDVFPIRPLCFRPLFASSDLWGTLPPTHDLGSIYPVGAPAYFWTPCIGINMPNIPDELLLDLQFSSDAIHGTIYGPGSHSYHFVKNHPELWTRFFGLQKSVDPSIELGKGVSYDSIEKKYGLHTKEIELVEMLPKDTCVHFLLDNSLLHFNKENSLRHQIKKRLVIEFIEEICALK